MMYNDELYHFGIPGMKWGKRRFQNYDGTLTDLGKRIKREATDRIAFATVKSGYKAPSNFGTRAYGNDYRDKYRTSPASAERRHLYAPGKMAPVGADFEDRRDYAQYKRLYNARTFSNPNSDRLANNIRNTNKAFDSFYDVKDRYSAPSNFGKTHTDFVKTHNEPYLSKGKEQVGPSGGIERKVGMVPPTYNASPSAIASRASRGGGKWTTDFDKGLDFDSDRSGSSTNKQHIPQRIASNYGYKQAANLVVSYAKSSVSSFATSAREKSGKAFTDYMMKMSEAAKSIDADLWSF